MTKSSIKPGQRYGKLTVVRFGTRDKAGNPRWECLCTCGTIIVRRGYAIRTGNTERGCGKCEEQELKPVIAAVIPYKNDIWDSEINTQKKRTAVKKRKWELNKEEFVELSQKPCHYCHMPAPLGKLCGYSRDVRIMGLDRVNNLGHYTYDNVVPCCQTCNFSKGMKSPEDFAIWVKRAYFYMYEHIA